MDLREFEVKPDDGLFEKIQHRLTVRRALRIGGMVLAGVAVAAVAVSVVTVLLLQDRRSADRPQLAVANENVTVVAEAENSVATMPTVAVKEVEEQHVAVAEVKPMDTIAKVVAVVAPEEKTTTWFSIEEIDSMIREIESVASKKEPVAQVEVAEPENETEEVASKPAAPKAGTPMPHYDNVIWAPNVIIPDGDIEDNRTFAIKATSQLSDFKLHIYNRNGRRIYMTSDQQFEWNGTMNGARVPQGAYVWVATFRDSDGVPRQEKGTVTVIR